MQTTATARLMLWTVVLGHFAVTLVHGAAHASANVPMTPAANVFIVLVIIAGPLAGLALLLIRPVLGAWVIAASMAGALLFGIVNHFVIDGPDHVSHVAEHSRRLFSATAILLAITETAGIGAAVLYGRAIRRAGMRMRRGAAQ
jgi:hypothetical protein